MGDFIFTNSEVVEINCLSGYNLAYWQSIPRWPNPESRFFKSSGGPAITVIIHRDVELSLLSVAH